MAFEAKVEQYEGPLDLMLHLISEHKLDIMDLDMDVLTEQYLGYLSKMKEKHLEIESEYLVELATLIEYKSKKLLPAKEKEELEEDPKDVLVRRLLEYQKYKIAAEQLENNYLNRQKHFAKPISDIEDDENVERSEGNPIDLLRAMNKVLRRMQLHKPVEVHLAKRELSLEERSLQIKARLNDLGDTFDLETLLDDCNSRYELALSFLAILVLAHEHVLHFTVDEDDRVWFKRG